MRFTSIGILVLFFMIGACASQPSKTGDDRANYVVIGSGIKLRAEPKIDAKEIATLNIGDELTFIQRSKDTESISGVNDSWYQVQWGMNNRGWIFGKWLWSIEPKSSKLVPLKLSNYWLTQENHSYLECLDIQNYLEKKMTSAPNTNPNFNEKLLANKKKIDEKCQELKNTASTTASPAGYFWGVNSDGSIYYGAKPTALTPHTVNWVQVPGVASQVSVGANGAVWALGKLPSEKNENATIYYRLSVNPSAQMEITANPENPMANWQAVNGGLVNIAVAPNGDIWGVNSFGSIYYASAPFEGAAPAVGSPPPSKLNWVQVPGVASKVSVGVNGAVWALLKLSPEQNGSIYYRPGITASAPTGTDASATSNWQLVNGKLVNMSLAPNGDIWGVNSEGTIYYAPAPFQGSSPEVGSQPTTLNWRSIPDPVSVLPKEVSVDLNGTIWLLTKTNAIYFSTAGFLTSRTDWQLVYGQPGRIKSLTLADIIPKKGDLVAHYQFIKNYLAQTSEYFQQNDINVDLYNGIVGIGGHFGKVNGRLAFDFFDYLRSEQDIFIKSGIEKIEFEYTLLYALFMATQGQFYYAYPDDADVDPNGLTLDEVDERIHELPENYRKNLYYVNSDTSWFVELSAFQALGEQAGKTPLGEKILGESSMFPTGGECEGDKSCVLSRYLYKLGPYLQAYPTGKYAKKYLDSIAKWINSSDKDNPELQKLISTLPPDKAEILKKSLDPR